MTHDIDLTSPQWTDLIFEGKNKEYGAYEMRNDSSNRHLKALLIITVVGLAAVYLPSLIKPDTAAKDLPLTQITDVTLSDVKVELKNVAIEQPVTVPPEAVMTTTGFVTPTVVPDDLVDLNDGMPTQDVLSDPNVHISSVTVQGTGNGTIDIGRDPVAVALDPVEAPKKPFEFVEQMPQFPGGEKEMMSWLSRHIQYPPIASEQGIQGRVVLRFVVRPDGSIDDVVIVKSLELSCDKEAIRAVKNMPKWIPGRQNGNPVSVYYNIPVQFKLQN